MKQKAIVALRASLLTVLLAGMASAQTTPYGWRTHASNVIVPQLRPFVVETSPAVEMTHVDAEVEIVDQVATTAMQIHLKNPTGARLEAELVMPVPEEAVVRGFSYQGAGGEMSAAVMPKEEARRLYESIVAKLRDPALLEFVGYNLVRSSVFPVEPNATQTVRLTYEHVLKSEGDRIDYLLPRSESLDYRSPWNITVKIRSEHPISTLYSPSHRMDVQRVDKNAIKTHITEDASREPGPFRLSYLIERNGMNASLFAYPGSPRPASAFGSGAELSAVAKEPPDKAAGGYFLLLVGLPAEPRKGDKPAIKREVTLVFDRSGSMNGEKLNQVREAAFQMLAGLEEGEAFNIVVYNEGVDRFAAAPVLKSSETVAAARAYLQGVNARGGTNIHDALIEALQQKPTEGVLPIVLFLTDGLPTIGQTSEVAIREAAAKRNPHNRRIFTFGVGVDVNTPLLSKIASETRATATFVLPKEDVEVKVGQVFKRLTGPVLAGPELAVVDASGNAAPGRVRDVMPIKMPDLFEADQYVILGQYVGSEPLDFKLAGNYLGERRTFAFHFDLDKAATRNAFVPRLWASRKIGFLIDAVREMGGDGGPKPSTTGAPSDPRLKELTDQIIGLSTEFGILTEYTAFLARDGAAGVEGRGTAAPRPVLPVLGDIPLLGSHFLSRGGEYGGGYGGSDHSDSSYSSFSIGRAYEVRSGLGAINQEKNIGAQMSQTALNTTNRFFDPSMNLVEVSGVQQVSDRAFYRRGNRWVDSRLLNAEREPVKTIEFGSEPYFDLVRRLTAEGRQGVVALQGDILLDMDGEVVLVKGPDKEKQS